MHQILLRTYLAVPIPVRQAAKRMLPTRIVQYGSKQLAALHRKPSTDAISARSDHKVVPASQNISGTFDLSPPSGARIPEAYLPRAASSPILARVPPTEYLLRYQDKKELHKEYGTLSRYFTKAVVRPDVISSRLWENDLRVAAYMDNFKTALARKYLARRQDELVSVIMPTKNRSQTIVDAVLSIQLQSYQNWELIVVDDASETPETRDALDAFSDERIRYVRLLRSVGNGQARNEGLKKSRGSVIAYLDDDDQWDPDHLLILLNQMRDAGAVCAYGAQAVWSGFDEQVFLGNAFKCIRFAPFNRSLLENANYISMISLIHDRVVLNQVGAFDTDLQRYLDWDFFLRLTEVETPVAVPSILSHYYQKRHATSVSAPADKEAAIAAIRSRQVGRSDWSTKFKTTGGTVHTAYGTAISTRRSRAAIIKRVRNRFVEIIIPNYECEAQIKDCLESIDRFTSHYRVTVVDNGSSPKTREKLVAHCSRHKNVELILDDGPKGFTHAVNRGLASLGNISSDVLILNNDTLVTPDWLDELRYILYKHPDAAMAVPRQVLPANSKIIRPHVPGAMDTYECDINLSFHHDNIIDPQFDIDDRLVELLFAPLFCSLVRADVMADLIELDARNGPHYRSDWILCDTVRRLYGKKILYTPFSKVYHLQGVASTALRKQGVSLG